MAILQAPEMHFRDQIIALVLCINYDEQTHSTNTTPNSIVYKKYSMNPVLPPTVM